MSPSDDTNSTPYPMFYCAFCGLASEEAYGMTVSSRHDVAICDACVEVARRMLLRDGLIPELNIKYSFAEGEEPMKQEPVTTSSEPDSSGCPQATRGGPSGRW